MFLIDCKQLFYGGSASARRTLTMDGLEMAMHVARLRERPVANWTNVRLFSRMHALMLGKRGEIAKRLAALAASVWSLSRVYALMCGQTGALHERLCAITARVAAGELRAMSSDVRAKARAICKLLAALDACDLRNLLGARL